MALRSRKSYAAGAANEIPINEAAELNDDPPPDAEEQLEAEAEADVMQGLRELAGSGEIKWHIFRIDNDPTRAGFLATWQTSQLALENIRDQFGGGKYRVRGHYPNGQFAAVRTIDVAGDAIMKPKPGAALPGDATGVLTMLREENERRRLDSEKRKEDVKFWAGILSPILAPAVINIFGGGKKESINDLVGALANLKTLQGGDTDKLSEFVKMIELGQSLGGKGGGETNWLDIVKEGLGLARPALEKVIDQAANRIPNLAAAPSIAAPVAAETSALIASGSSPGAVVPVATLAAAPSGDPMLMLIPWLKNQLEFLILQAARNKDPELYAELLLDNIPDGVAPVIIQGMLSRSDWWAMLSNFNLAVAPYQGWFTNLRAAALEMLANAEERSAEKLADEHSNNNEEGA